MLPTGRTSFSSSSSTTAAAATTIPSENPPKCPPKCHYSPSERLNRVQLCRLPICELRHLRQLLGQRVEAANANLVELLERRDCLSMQRDALAVEVQDLQDLLAHNQATIVNTQGNGTNEGRGGGGRGREDAGRGGGTQGRREERQQDLEVQ